MSKSGVAVEGKAAAEPANGKANGQVSAFRYIGSIDGEPHGTKRPLATWVPWWKGSGWESVLNSQVQL